MKKEYDSPHNSIQNGKGAIQGDFLFILSDGSGHEASQNQGQDDQQGALADLS